MSDPDAVVIAPKMGGSDMVPVPETFRTALNDQAQGIYGDLTAGESLSKSGDDWVLPAGRRCYSKGLYAASMTTSEFR